MRFRTRAFVLRAYPMGEADRCVILFSRDEGKLRGVARGAAASRKRFGGALGVLSEVDVWFEMKEGRELGRLESAELIQPTPGEGRDLEAFYACAYLAEVLDQFTREGEADSTLYRLVVACSAALAGGTDPYLLARYFEVWTLRLAGLLPSLRLCPACGLDLAGNGAVFASGGEALCRRCAGGSEERLPSLAPSALALMRSMLSQAPAHLPQAVSIRDLVAVAEVAAAQFRQLLEHPFRTAASLVPRGGFPGARLLGVAR